MFKFHFAHQNLGCFGITTPWFYMDVFKQPYFGMYFHFQGSHNRYYISLRRFWRGFRKSY